MTKKLQWVSFHFVAEAVNDNSLIEGLQGRDCQVKACHVDARSGYPFVAFLARRESAEHRCSFKIHVCRLGEMSA